VANPSQPSKAPFNYSPITQYGSWIVLAVVLTGAAQFDSTAQLAAYFAYLILVTATLWYGPAAIANVNGFISPTKVAVVAKPATA
jgi:hypothetical protein